MRAMLALAVAGLMGATAANALQVSFGQRPGTSEGTVSPFYTDARFTNEVPLETFSVVEGSMGAQGCGSTGTTVVGSYSFFQPDTDARGVHLAPQGGFDCYIVANDPAFSGSLSGTTDILVNDANPAGNGMPEVPLTYLGFLLGSPDSYNTFQLLDTSGNLITNNTFGGLVKDGSGILRGDEILAAKNGAYTGDPGNAGTLYINFNFGPSEHVGGIEIGQTGNCCTEIDNLAYSTVPVFDSTNSPRIGPTPQTAPGAHLVVPEPAAGVALLSGLGLLALARRKRG